MTRAAPPAPGDGAAGDDDVLERIAAALGTAAAVLSRFTPGAVETTDKGGGEPVTAADHAVDRALRETLPRDGEGWLSEETEDDPERLTREWVWVVDPLDGTHEFVDGIPEWCVSVGLVVGGRAVAGGIHNPASGETVLGSLRRGATYNGEPATVSRCASLARATVAASRSETRRGEWERFRGAPFAMRPMGSVAYKLAMVAAGRVDATWTLVPKHEWDVAAGVALVRAAGGTVYDLTGREPAFNQARPRLRGLVAHPPALTLPIRSLLAIPNENAERG